MQFWGFYGSPAKTRKQDLKQISSNVATDTSVRDHLCYWRFSFFVLVWNVIQFEVLTSQICCVETFGFESLIVLLSLWMRSVCLKKETHLVVAGVSLYGLWLVSKVLISRFSTPPRSWTPVLLNVLQSVGNVSTLDTNLTKILKLRRPN